MAGRKRQILRRFNFLFRFTQRLADVEISRASCGRQCRSDFEKICAGKQLADFGLDIEIFRNYSGTQLIDITCDFFEDFVIPEFL